MRCKNCGTEYDDHHNFCPNCGARNIRNRLTPDVLAKQANEEFFSVDNKLLRTFIALFTKPEDVIVGYIKGTRKKYLNVIQYFAFSLTLAGIQVFIMTTFFKEALEINLYEGMEDLPGQENNPFKNLDFEFFNNYQGLIYILGVPISAFSTWIVYYLLGNRRFNFTEHLVLNLYYSAQVIIVTAIVSIFLLMFGFNYFVVSTIVTIPLFGYLFYILLRVFKESFADTLAKYLLVMITYFITYFGIGIVVAIIAAIITYASSQ